MAGHYFISYSRLEEGTQFALRLADELEAGAPPFSVFVDVRDLQPGQDWDRQLVEAIQTCVAVLFVMTEDSVRDESGCRAEWAAALRYKKPVIPLRLSPEADLAFRLASRQFIDFSAGFEEGLARLRKHCRGRPRRPEYCRICAVATPTPNTSCRGLIRHSARASSVSWRSCARASRSSSSWSTVRRAVVEQADARIEARMERERQPERPGAGPPAKFVNPPPLGLPPHFEDRRAETEEIGTFLADAETRMLSVVGRGGSGKTALVCRVLKALERDALPDNLGALTVDGIVYLSPVGRHTVNFANLFGDLCRLLSTELAEPLLRRSRDPQEAPAALMRALLEQFRSGRTVVLLDALEVLVDPSSLELADQALEEALRALLTAPNHGVKVIITSRVAPRSLGLVQPVVQRQMVLDAGLASPFAETFLRNMDPDGTLGIRAAPDSLLAEAVRRTRGLPRALEALVAVLAADGDTTLPVLLDRAAAMPENVAEALVGEAFSRLDPADQLVVQALAVYGRPVPAVAVDYLLQPVSPGIDSAPMLDRLGVLQFVRRDASRYAVHPGGSRVSAPPPANR